MYVCMGLPDSCGVVAALDNNIRIQPEMLVSWTYDIFLMPLLLREREGGREGERERKRERERGRVGGREGGREGRREIRS